MKQSSQVSFGINSVDHYGETISARILDTMRNERNTEKKLVERREDTNTLDVAWVVPVIFDDSKKQIQFVVAERVKSSVGEVTFPGGKIASGELPIDCAVRELKEETGIDLSADTLFTVEDKPLEFNWRGTAVKAYSFYTYLFGYDFNRTETNKQEKWRFVLAGNLEKYVSGNKFPKGAVPSHDFIERVIENVYEACFIPDWAYGSVPARFMFECREIALEADYQKFREEVMINSNVAQY